MHRSTTALLVALAAAAAGAQPSPAPMPPPGHVRVDAPLAERLVRQAMAAHPVLRKLGLHATPAGGGNVIIASDAPAKIGKPSSAADMAHLATGRPSVTRIDGQGIYDLLLPIAEVADEAAALAVGRDVRDALQRAIPDKAALYGP